MFLRGAVRKRESGTPGGLKALTFDDVADRYLREGVAHKAASTISVETAYLVSARAAFKDRKAKDISRQDVIDFLAARAVGTPVAANRTLEVLATLFGWAVERGILETTPIVKIGKPTKREIPKDRVLTEREIVPLWRAFDDLDKQMAAALRLLLVTGQRPSQVAAVELGELHDLHDPEGAAWHIPAAKRKDPRGSKRGPHVVPLAQFAVEIVESALASRSPGDSSPAVFLSRRNGGAAIERNSLSQALQRLVTCLDARRLDAAPRRSPAFGASRRHRTILGGPARRRWPRSAFRARTGWPCWTKLSPAFTPSIMTTMSGLPKSALRLRYGGVSCGRF